MFGRSFLPTSGDTEKSGVKRPPRSASDGRLFNTDPRISSQRGRGEPQSNPAQAAKSQPPQPMGRILTVPKGISLSGKIDSCDVLIIEGSVEATLTDGKIIRIAEGGTFRGTIEIAEAEIAGIFEGTINVHGRLTVRNKGRVAGKIRYGQLAVEPGGHITGEISSLEKRDHKATERTAQAAQALNGLLVDIEDEAAVTYAAADGEKQHPAGDLMRYAARQTSS